MREENVELVRLFVDAFNRGPGRGPDPTEIVDPAIVIHADPAWPGKLEYRGLPGTLEARAEWFDNFEDLTWEIERIVEADDRAVVLFHLRGRIKGGSSDSLEMGFGGVFRFRGGRVVEVRFFFSQDAALEAAGLRE